MIVMRYFLSTLLLFSSGCRPRETAVDGDHKTVSVSILPLKYLIDSIGGGDFETLVVMPPGSNPETYEPLLSQMKGIAHARANFQVGLIDFEKSLDNRLKSNSLSANFIDLSEGMSLIAGGPESSSNTSTTNHHAGLDPHIWLSPTRVRVMARKIADTLMEIQPDSATKYATNRDRVISTIDSVDRYIIQSFSELKNNSFLIFHPSLTYYAADYGLQQIPVELEGKEPSVAHMRSLMQLISGQKINTVIHPQAQNRHTVEALIQEAGLRAVPFDPVAYDWPANMKYITDHIKASLNE